MPSAARGQRLIAVAPAAAGSPVSRWAISELISSKKSFSAPEASSAAPESRGLR